MSLRAVLFDFDDTLVDVSSSREERVLRAYRRLQDEGVRISWQAFWYAINDLDEGGFYRRGMEAAVADLGLENTPLGDECVGLWRFRGAEDLLTLSAGCTEVLDLLASRYQLGVITNGPADSQKHKFAHTGLAAYFEVFLPSGEIGVHKPDPRIYRVALARMGLQPHEAVFVGDHLDLDVIGAQRTGMRAIWYRPKHHRPYLPHIVPDATIRRLDELPGVLEAIERET